MINMKPLLLDKDGEILGSLEHLPVGVLPSVGHEIEVYHKTYIVEKVKWFFFAREIAIFVKEL